MEIEPPEMEENIALESSPVPIAARFLDQLLDPAVDPLRRGVAQMVPEVRDDIDPVGRHHPRHLLHRRELGGHRFTAPRLEEGQSVRLIRAFPERSEKLFDLPGPRRLRRRLPQGLESLGPATGEVLPAIEPQLARPLQLEGALAPEDRERHREHLECCADCGELLEDFEDIARQARELPRVEPSDAAWPAILRRVREARSEAAVPSTPRKKWFEAIFAPGRMVYAGASALLVLAVVGGLVLARRPAAGVSEQDRYTMTKLEEAEKYYTLAIKALSEAVGSPRSGLDPQVASVLEQNLREIDTAIQACQKAVKMAPGDLTARVYLLGAYKNKVEFLDNVIEVKKYSASARTNGRTL
jgi:hypothetical protein